MGSGRRSTGRYTASEMGCHAKFPPAHADRRRGSSSVRATLCGRARRGRPSHAGFAERPAGPRLWLSEWIYPQPNGVYDVRLSRAAAVDFSVTTRGAMISVTRGVCDRSHRGRANDRAGREGLMASHPMGPGSAVPPSEWRYSAHAYTSGQLMACVRAGVIALVLLGILALIVLF